LDFLPLWPGLLPASPRVGVEGVRNGKERKREKRRRGVKSGGAAKSEGKRAE
jgi:hypothetical protein